MVCISLCLCNHRTDFAQAQTRTTFPISIEQLQKRMWSLVNRFDTPTIVNQLGPRIAIILRRAKVPDARAGKLAEGLAYAYSMEGKFVRAGQLIDEAERLAPAGQLSSRDRIYRCLAHLGLWMTEEEYVQAEKYAQRLVDVANKAEGLSAIQRRWARVVALGLHGLASLNVSRVPAARSDRDAIVRDAKGLTQEEKGLTLEDRLGATAYFDLEIALSAGDPSRARKYALAGKAAFSVNNPGADLDERIAYVKCRKYFQAQADSADLASIFSSESASNAQKLQALAKCEADFADPGIRNPFADSGNLFGLADAYVSLKRRPEALAAVEQADRELRSFGVPMDRASRQQVVMRRLGLQDAGAAAGTLVRCRQWVTACAVLQHAYDWSRFGTGADAISAASDAATNWTDSGWLLDSPQGQRLLADAVLGQTGAIRDCDAVAAKVSAQKVKDPSLQAASERLRKEQDHLTHVNRTGERPSVTALTRLEDAERDFDHILVSRGYGHVDARNADVQFVQRWLHPGEAYIQFVRLRRNNYLSGFRYAAITITKNRFHMGWVGRDEQEVNKAVESWWMRVDRRQHAVATRPGSAFSDTSQLLYAKLLLTSLGPHPRVSRLYVVPDGKLSDLNFAALRTPDGQYLLERFPVCLLGSGADLAPPIAPASVNPSVAMISPEVPGIAVALGKKAMQEERTSMEAEAADVRAYDRRAVCVRGSEANTEALRRLERPRALHIACHGTYLNYNGSDDWVERQRFLMTAVQLLLSPTRKQHVDSFSPLQAATLDLRGTALVFLSACDAGEGVTMIGEGLWGLRRGFRIAGARNVVAPICAVSDTAETAELVHRFYQSLTQDPHRDVVNALRSAQIGMIHAGLDPAAWAGFVVEGKG
jgi:CHAT domain-containing protein